jgi:hypothetical protein
MEYICEFCNKNFKSKGILKTHQMSAKFCLNLRNNNLINQQYECEHCEKKYTVKVNLDSHLLKCRKRIENHYKKIIEEKDKIIETKESEIKYLHNQIKELASIAIEKPNVINHVNNNSNNKMIDNRTLNMVPFNLTEEKVLEVLKEKFQEKHLLKGQEGLANFFVENVLITPEKKFLYRCTDSARNHFIFVDENGKIQKDINAYHLTRIINEPIKQITKEIYQDYANRYFDNNVYNDENNDGSDTADEDKLMFITDKVTEIANLKNNNSKFIKGLIPPLIINK